MNLYRLLLWAALLAAPAARAAEPTAHQSRRAPRTPYVAPPSPVLFGEAERFNDDWRFSLTDPADGAAPACADTAWRQLRLPHDWSVEGPLSPSLASCTGYLPGGIAWYRKHFTADPQAGERLYIYFEGVYNRSEVYLNGQLLGKRPNGYVSFLYELTPHLQAGDNVLAVRVDHSRYADSRWYSGSGIYRDVWLVRAPATHLAQWGTTWRMTRIDARSAAVEVESTLERAAGDDRPLELRVAVLDAEGRPVAQRRTRLKAAQCEATVPLTIPAPRRWELDDPYLYTVQVDLFDGNRRIDGCNTRMGLRTLTFDPDRGFALNDRWMKVKGVCLHHDAGVLGAAVPREVWQRRLENLKAIGANAIRMSHNPQAPDLYDLCDEMGFLVMDEGSDEWEFPKRKWLAGWNEGTPGFDGTYDFFEEWIERDVADMVRRDRNHPSIFLWSVGNEVDYPNDPYSHPVLDSVRISQPNYSGYNPDAPDARRIGKIAERLAAVIKTYDRTRPTTGAMAGVAMSNATTYPDAVDICGYNYTESRYDLDHATYPRRIIYGSENRPDYLAWRAVAERDFIFGQFLWTGIDYLGESRAWPSRGFYSGMLDLAGFVKPGGQFRAALWRDDPVLYIGTLRKPARGARRSGGEPWDVWNYEAGDTVQVICYTNAPQARLLLDGTQAGAPQACDPRTGFIRWELPYRPGELPAEGLGADGSVCASYAIRTSGRPYALRARVDRERLGSDRATAHIVVEVVDEQGIPVKLADNELTCTVEGPLRLLGLENADNSDMSDWTDNRHRVHRGRLLAYVQTTGTAGTATVAFKSPLLEGCSLRLDIEE